MFHAANLKEHSFLIEVQELCMQCRHPPMMDTILEKQTKHFEVLKGKQMLSVCIRSNLVRRGLKLVLRDKLSQITLSGL